VSTSNPIEVRRDGALVSEGKVIARPGPEHAITMAIQLLTATFTQSLINPTPIIQADAEQNTETSIGA